LCAASDRRILVATAARNSDVGRAALPDQLQRKETRLPALSRRIYRSTRDLHLYVGLFISPFVTLFALSVIFLNHAWLPWGGADAGEASTTTVAIRATEVENSLEMAKQIQRQIGVPGEIDFINRNEEERRVSFPITAPGERTMVRVDLRTGVAEVERRETGVWDAMVYLHKMPGPHNVAVRGNWFFTRMWAWLADATVYLLLFVTASGVYIWTVAKAERKAGLIFLGAGVLYFSLLVGLLVG
jgi:hypothetical protein